MTTRVLLQRYAQAWDGVNLIVSAATDVDAHGYLRWTDTPMRMHLRGDEARGLLKMTDPKYCFVEWHEVEQSEPGDSPVHTFSFGPWAPEDCRWWYFRWTVATIGSPSNTAIFADCYHEDQSMLSLGILGDPVMLHGDVKLTPGANVSLTSSTPLNAIMVSGA